MRPVASKRDVRNASTGGELLAPFAPDVFARRRGRHVLRLDDFLYRSAEVVQPLAEGAVCDTSDVGLQIQVASVCESVKASANFEFQRNGLSTGRRSWTPRFFTFVAVNVTKLEFVAKLADVLHAHPELLEVKAVLVRVQVHIPVQSAAIPAVCRANDWLAHLIGDSIKIRRHRPAPLVRALLVSFRVHQ